LPARRPVSRRSTWEATFRGGHKAGTEVLWRENGVKQWERTYEADGRWTWQVYDNVGKPGAQSKWRGKDLIEVR
jgi:hypothetical protein